jgi:tetratricopeptide (TPR) repeat protein
MFLLQCAYYNTLFNANKEFKKGIELLQEQSERTTNSQAERHFNETIDKCWKLLEIYSDKSKYADDALLLIIKSEFYLDKMGQSRLHLNQFLSKYPKSELIPEIYLWSGKLFLEEEDEEAGVENLTRSLTLTNKSEIRSQAYYELGNIAFEKGEYPEAIDLFEKALDEKITKEYAAFIQFYLGEAYFQQEDYEEAIKRYKRVEKFSPSVDVEYKTKYNLARSYSRNNNDKEALNLLRKMLTAPRFKNFVPFIKSEIANIYHKQGNVLEAVDLYKEVIMERFRSPGTALASFELAKVYEHTLQNVDSAVFYYGQVKKLFPTYDSVEVAENTHLFLSELKKIKDSIKQDARLAFRLENDSYFRDSLYKAQFEDSLFGYLNKKEGSILDSALIDSLLADSLLHDTLSIDTLLSLPEMVRDSILSVLQDSLHKRDSLRQVLRADSLERFGTRRNFVDRTDPNRTETSTNMNRSTDAARKKKEEKILEKRKLPEIKEDLEKNRFHLAEFFLLEVQNYDSALVNYHYFLDNFQDSILTPKALYSIYFIHSQPSHLDPVIQDSIGNLLINDYPESSFAKNLLKRQGLLADEIVVDSTEVKAKELFLQAEEMYEKGLSDSALSLYKEVSNIDRNLEWSAKAQLARAWIYEHDINDINDAINEYKLLYENYDFDEFKKLASKKISTPVDKTQPTAAVKQASEKTYFTTTEGDSGKVSEASSAISPAVPVEIDQSTLPTVAKTKRYRQWRMDRTRK